MVPTVPGLRLRELLGLPLELMERLVPTGLPVPMELRAPVVPG